MDLLQARPDRAGQRHRLAKQLEPAVAALRQAQHAQIANHHPSDPCRARQLELLRGELVRPRAFAQRQIRQRRGRAPGDPAGARDPVVVLQASAGVERILQRRLGTQLREPQLRTDIEQEQNMDRALNLGMSDEGQRGLGMRELGALDVTARERSICGAHVRATARRAGVERSLCVRGCIEDPALFVQRPRAAVARGRVCRRRVQPLCRGHRLVADLEVAFELVDRTAAHPSAVAS